MARKGSQKVKTGCYTCKVRKIKCDEAKPECQRCTSTGRKCDGYPPRTQGSYSWDELLNPGAIIPAPSVGRTNREGRALEFFCHVVAPGLSIYPDKQFWTHLVPAATQDNPAIRHAVVAISSIYELLDEKPANNILDSRDGRFALGHYNQALNLLVSGQVDSSSMLFLCILFVCIESLQLNIPGSIEHCRHGVKILNSTTVSSWARDYLLPVFVRLSIFPFFFGGTITSFPPLECLMLSGNSAPYNKLDDAVADLDLLVARGIRFIRSTDTFRHGILSQVPFPESVCREHQQVSVTLGQWQQDFYVFKATHPPASSRETAAYANALMKGLLGKVWIDSSLDKTEMSWDLQFSSFRAIVETANEVLAALPPGEVPGSKARFSFDMGFLPLLYLVILKCRDLRTRYGALRAMAGLALKNEGLWELASMYAIGKRVIIIEHKVDLEAYGRGECPEADDYIPPDLLRVYDALATKQTRVDVNDRGQHILSMRVTFLFRQPTVGGFRFVDEWHEMGPVPGQAPAAT